MVQHECRGAEDWEATGEGTALAVSAFQIIEATARRHGCEVKQLTGPNTVRSVVRARREAMLWIRTHLGMSYREIGKLFGNRDHATVHVGCDEAFKAMRARGAA